MKLVLKVLTTLSLVGLLSANSFAKEGFYSDPKLLPVPLQKAWDQVWQLVKGDPADGYVSFSGSSVLMTVLEISADQLDFLFITNAHNVKKCIQGNFCRNYNLTYDLLIDSNGDVVQEPKFKFSPKLLAKEESLDLAILSFQVPKNSPVVDWYIGLPDIRLACIDDQQNYKPDYIQKNEPVFAIGFPFLIDRYDLNKNDERYLVKKRWSVGLYDDLYKSPKSSEHNLAGTTADALKGISGGITLNGRGEILGINVMGSGKKDSQNKDAYTGVEPLGEGENWQSFYIPCEFVYNYSVDYLISRFPEGKIPVYEPKDSGKQNY